MKKIEELLAMLGTDDVVEAVRNLDSERLGMLELDVENKELKNYSKRVQQVVEMALKVFDLMEAECGLFMTGKIRELIRKSREQMAAVEKEMSEGV